MRSPGTPAFARAHAREAAMSLGLFLPCLGGMAAGLMIDSQTVHPDALVSMCTSAGSFVARVARDWTLMPATHALMLVTAIAAAVIVESLRVRVHAARVCIHVMCLCAMTAGMALGGPLAAQFSAMLGVSSFAGLMVAMGAGMAGGMAIAAPLYRWVSE